MVADRIRPHCHPVGSEVEALPLNASVFRDRANKVVMKVKCGHVRMGPSSRAHRPHTHAKKKSYKHTARWQPPRTQEANHPGTVLLDSSASGIVKTELPVASAILS